MVWFNVDDGFAFQRKTLLAGNTALGLWVRAGAYCAQQLSDGMVPEVMLSALGGRPKDAAALVEAELWDKVDGGWLFHDWTKYNRTRAQVESARAATKSRQDKHRLSRVTERVTDGVTNSAHAVAVAVPSQSKKEQPPNPSSEAVAIRPDVERICSHLADRIEGNGSKRPRITEGWRTSARLLLDLDGRTEAQVLTAIDWCQSDEFWRSNVLSMPTLREKYDQLRLAAARTNTPTQRPSGIARALNLAERLSSETQEIAQ